MAIWLSMKSTRERKLRIVGIEIGPKQTYSTNQRFFEGLDLGENVNMTNGDKV